MANAQVIVLPPTSADAPATPQVGVRDPQKVAELTAELQSLKVRDLTTRAATNGADEDTLDRLDELSKEELIELFLKKEREWEVSGKVN